MILLDWEKAFDKIEHEWLFRTLDYFEVLGEISDTTVLRVDRRRKTKNSQTDKGN